MKGEWRVSISIRIFSFATCQNDWLLTQDSLTQVKMPPTPQHTHTQMEVNPEFGKSTGEGGGRVEV